MASPLSSWRVLARPLVLLEPDFGARLPRNVCILACVRPRRLANGCTTQRACMLGLDDSYCSGDETCRQGQSVHGRGMEHLQESPNQLRPHFTCFCQCQSHRKRPSVQVLYNCQRHTNLLERKSCVWALSLQSSSRFLVPRQRPPPADDHPLAPHRSQSPACACNLSLHIKGISAESHIDINERGKAVHFAAHNVHLQHQMGDKLSAQRTLDIKRWQ